jgi:hypothetical protein
MNCPISRAQFVVLLATIAVLPACTGRAEVPLTPAVTSVAPAIDQASLCEVNDYGLASACKPGQKIVFLPRSFGNEQLPILFAAINCDLRYAVALTNGAVTCIHGPITPAKAEEAAPEPASGPTKP